MFQVTLRFNGEPDWAAGEYPTREAAAHAAAELYVIAGPSGERPIGVGVTRTPSALHALSKPSSDGGANEL